MEEDPVLGDPVLGEEKPVMPAPRPFRASLAQSQNTKPFPSSEVRVEEPRVYEDSLAIAAFLREGKPVIINLKYLDGAVGKRLIDFICGTAYAINGHMMKIGENIFLFTPSVVSIVESGGRVRGAEAEIPEEERDVFFKRAAV